MDAPSLDIVKPGTKEQLRGADAIALVPFPIDVEAADSSTAAITAEVQPPVSLERCNDSVYIDGVLTRDECAALCASIEASPHLSFWNPDEAMQECSKDFRDADTIELLSPEFAQFLWRRVCKVKTYPTITIEDQSGLDEQDERWERELVGTWEPYCLNADMLFARYKSGGHFAPHTDGRAISDFNTRSFYSVVTYLNDIPEGMGGGTKFYEPEALSALKTTNSSSSSANKTAGYDYTSSISTNDTSTSADGDAKTTGASKWTADDSLHKATCSPVAGRMLIFEQSLAHEGVPPSAPYYKYIIRSDVMYKRTPPICDEPQDREAYRVFKHAEQLAEAGKVEESIPQFRRAIKMSPKLAAIMGH